jgi:anti-anti-sigma factor
MEVTMNNENGTTGIKISGRLDAVNSADFEKAIMPMLQGSIKHVAVDCSALEYTSSAGLRVFLQMQKAAKSADAKITLKGMTAEVRSVFDMVGFSPLFEFI